MELTSRIPHSIQDIKEYDFCNAESFSAEGNYNDFIEDMEGVIGQVWRNEGF